MKTNYLFPSRLKVLSGVLFVASLALLIVYVCQEDFDLSLNSKVFAIISEPVLGPGPVYFQFTEDNVIDELLMVLVLCSGIVFAFTKEKDEDEFVATIRLHSLAWATILNYSILLFCYLLIYGLPFFNVLMVAMFSQLLIFIILFRYKMYRFYNTRQDEE